MLRNPNFNLIFEILSRRADIASGHEEAAVEKILDGLAHEVNASVGVRMHRLGVCEWEVKLWISSDGEANGAWRVVVTNVTGHTCIVHVSQIYAVMKVYSFYFP